MRKDVKLYNLIFPMWSVYFFGLFFLPLWGVLLPANFIVDTLVLFLLFWRLKLENKKELYKKSILKTWGFGFLADFIASGVLIGASEMIEFPFHVYTINAGSLLFTTVGVLLAGGLIYFFHIKYIWRKIEIEAGQKKKIALGMAILTAPYLMYLPPM